MGEGRFVYRIWWRFLRERDHLEDSYLDKRIIFECIFRRWKRGHGLN